MIRRLSTKFTRLAIVPTALLAMGLTGCAGGLTPPIQNEIYRGYAPPGTIVEPRATPNVVVEPRHQFQIVCEWRYGQTYDGRRITGGFGEKKWWVRGQPATKCPTQRADLASLIIPGAIQESLARYSGQVCVFLPRRDDQGQLIAGESSEPTIRTCGRDRIRPTYRRYHY